ncbi:putative proteasomal ubiquitin receptor ADRM1-like [Apostichopus japonicus]|uniref:Putative proteasomal ubiquitin receptor ADRM1-like n=1 Tax=Stichopus japonicus TaxID=307972 RepID=A0A2G8KQ04_STIJA|nr:putative proteasomal ubiquitin receptor ADRM1-like [Apostichopus japonicus]
MSGALFGHSSVPGRAPSKNLVEFRAGKMHLKGTTVTPDKRKGLLYVYQADDSLIHFCWKDRTSGVVEDDLIIFPDDCEFKRIQQCTTGRVYLLKFKSNARKFFFWLQEPKTDKDEDNCKKVNETLNNPPAPGSSLGGGLGGGRGGLPAELAGLGASLGDSGLQSMLGNVDQQQLMQLLGSSGMGLGGLGLAGLSGLTPQPTSSSPSAAKPPASNATVEIPTDQTPQASVDFAQVLTSDVMAPLLENERFQEQLLQHAPEGENLPRDPQRLRETIHSPQFQQAMSMFTAAFQSGQLGPLIGQFNLGAEATEAANRGDLEAFSKALQGAEGSKESGGKKTKLKTRTAKARRKTKMRMMRACRWTRGMIVLLHQSLISFLIFFPCLFFACNSPAKLIHNVSLLNLVS